MTVHKSLGLSRTYKPYQNRIGGSQERRLFPGRLFCWLLPRSATEEQWTLCCRADSVETGWPDRPVCTAIGAIACFQHGLQFGCTDGRRARPFRPGLRISIARSTVDKSFGLSCTCEQYRAVRASALTPTDLRASEAAARTAESPIEKAGQYRARCSLWSFFANKQHAATTGNTQHANVGPSQWTRWHWSDRCDPGLVFSLASNEAFEMGSWWLVACHRIGGRKDAISGFLQCTTPSGVSRIFPAHFLDGRRARHPVFNISRSCRYRRASVAHFADFFNKLPRARVSCCNRCYSLWLHSP